MASFAEAGVAMVVKDLAQFQSDIGKADKSVGGFAKSAAGAAGKMALGIGAAAATSALAIGGISVKAAIDFESAWTGVVKTTDGLVDEFGNLNEAGKELQDGFRDLAKEVPTSVEELMAIGELGGQLGIQKENLLDFTRVVAALGETTNLTTEEAAAGFARMANIMQTPQEEFSNMASAVVELGNNFATTERDILSFGERIAGAGAIAGLTESDVFAIGAAMSSVGVQAEAGGTAVQKVLLSMNEAAIAGGDQMEIFAAVSGLSADEFGAAWEEDAGAVFNEFVRGLGLAGDDAIGILSALGLEDQRLIRSFLSLAGAGDLLGEAMEKSGTAFADNTALAKEAELRYQTTSAQFDILKNSIKDVAISIGMALLPFVNKLIKAAKPLIDRFAKELPKFLEGTLLPAIEKVTEWLGENLPDAIQTLSQFWTTTLWPAIQTVVGFLTGTVIPIIQQIFRIFQNDGPTALSTTGSFLTETLIPAFQSLIQFIQTNVVPIIIEAVTFIQTEVGKFVEWFSTTLLPLIQEALEAIQRFWSDHGENIMATVNMIFGNVQKLISAAMEVIRNIIELVLNIVAGNWGDVWENVKTIAETIWGAIKTMIETAIGVVDTVLDTVLGEIGINWETVWGDIKKFVNDRWEDIKKLVETAIGIVQTVINTVTSAINMTWEERWRAIKQFLFERWEDIKTAVRNAIFSVYSTVKSILGEVKKKWDEIWESIRKAVVDKWEEIKTAVGERIQAVLDIVTGIASQFYNAGKNIIEQIKQGFLDAWAGFIQMVRDKIAELTGLLPWNSPPEDPNAKLRGLPQAGENLLNEMQKGFEKQFPKFLSEINAKLSTIIAPSMTLPPAAQPNGAGLNQRNIFNATINNEMDARVFEQRVLKIITENVG